MKPKKLAFLWPAAAAAAFVLAAAFVGFGVYASVMKDRTSGFAADATGAVAVCESDGYMAVADKDGRVSLYAESDPKTPVFSYESGTEITALSFSDGMLYAADGTSAGQIFAFTPEASADKQPAAVYRTGMLISRVFFGQGSRYLAATAGQGNNSYLYFFDKNTLGQSVYPCNYIREYGVTGVAVNGDKAYYSLGQTVCLATLGGTGEIFADPDFVHEFDVSVLGLAATENGFAAVNAAGTVELFDQNFVSLKKYDAAAGDITTVFSCKDNFVCKLQNGGIAGINCEKGLVFTIPTSSAAIIQYVSESSFAFLTEDGGRSVYYTFDSAARTQVYRNVWLAFILTGVVLLLVGGYAAACAFEGPRRKVNGFFAKVARTAYKHRFAYLGLLPTFLLLAIFYWYPIVQSLFVSFFDYLPGEKMDFIGLENFRQVVINTEFWRSFKNTLIFLVTDLAKALLPPIAFAELLLALRSKKASYLIRVLLFIPGILPGVASMLVWADGIFGSSSSGLLNGFMQALTPSWVSRGWLTNDRTALTALIFMNFPWVGSYLIFFGAISGVNKEIYEAAKIDGCGWARRVFTMDIPLIVPQMKYVFIQTFISSVQNYTLILVTTGGDYGTNTPALMMYLAMTLQRNYGLASAMGVILLLFLMVATIINFRMQIGGAKENA